MPTTKKKIAQSTEVATAATNGSPPEVFTLAEAAAYLRVSEASIIDLVHSQNLPARLIGSEWRFLKSAVRQWLCAVAAPAEARKEAQLALAGKYKDDPDLMHICEEAYRQRGRATNEGS